MAFIDQSFVNVDLSIVKLPSFKITISDDLRAFLREWLFDVEHVEPTHFKTASTIAGLCGCIGKFTGGNLIHRAVLDSELAMLFRSYNMCPAYPFGRDSYKKRKDNETLHECPLRIQFVRDILKK